MKRATNRAVVTLCVFSACHAPRPYHLSKSDEAAGSLRRYITVVEYTKNKVARLFYEGYENGQTSAPPHALYEIDSSSDLQISFRPEIRELGGSVSVRARLLRNPVVELPVQNFTTVTDKELKKETVLLLPRQSSLFRDDKYHKDVQTQLTATQSAAQQLSGYISLQMLPLFEPFWDRNTTRQPSGFSALKIAQNQQDYKVALAPLIDGLARADTLRTASRDKLVHLRDTVKDLFLDGDFVTDLGNDSFATIKRIARNQMDTIDGLIVGLDADYAQYSKVLSQCASNPELAYFITKPTNIYATVDDLGVAGKEGRGQLEAGQIITASKDPKAKDDKALRIVLPPDLEGMVIEAQNAKALGKQTGVLVCAGQALSALYKRLNADVEVAKRTSREIARPAEGALRQACASDKLGPQPVLASVTNPVSSAPTDLPAPNHEPDAGEPAASSTSSATRNVDDGAMNSGISDAIDAMECIVKNDILDNLASRIHDARIRLGENELVHGDMISVIVSISIPPIGFSRATLGSSPEPTVIEERFTLRVINRGWSFSTRPQFALIKRQSDVQAGTDRDSPSNYKPAPGVLLNFRYRTDHRASEWAIPSIGLAAFAVDFDPSKTFELGIGPSVGLLNDFLHAGIGADLSADRHRTYFFVSLDFLKTFDTFNTLFGGGAK